MPGGFVCSARCGGPRKADIRATVAGGLPIRKLFSQEQRAFYTAHAPEAIDLDDLTVLGPIFVLKLRFTPEELAAQDRRRDVALPGRVAPARALDQVPAAEAFQVSAVVRAYLATRGVDISGEQETKTKKALEYFSATRARRTGLRPEIVPAGNGARSATASGPPRRPSPSSNRTRRGERRAVPPRRGERCLGEGPGRADGRQAPRGRRRRGPRAVGARMKGVFPLAAADVAVVLPACASPRHRSPAPRTPSRTSWARSCSRATLCWRSTCTSDAFTTPSAAAWRSSARCARRKARRARSRSSPRTRPSCWPSCARSVSTRARTSAWRAG